MKIQNWLLALAGLLILSFWSGCKNDPCQDIWCVNNGTCVEGTCECPEGYYGDRCEFRDPCFGVTCENGGTCDSGICQCPPAWEGTNCDTLAATKFVGAYDVERTCGTDTTMFNCQISATQSPNDLLRFDNFDNLFQEEGVTAFVNGNVNGGGVVIGVQTLSGTSNTIEISGSGTWNGNGINLNYTKDINGDTTLFCRQVFTKQ